MSWLYSRALVEEYSGRTVCGVESSQYCASAVAQRQNDGILPPFPIWSDVRTFDGRPWAGRVDVVSGGFPCQDVSKAGRGKGLDGSKSGLWMEMARIISEVRPKHVFVENTPTLTSRGLDRVLGDLSTLGFSSWWGVRSARGEGAPHLRERLWVVATHTNRPRRGQQWWAQPGCKETTPAELRGWWSTEPKLGRVAHGLAYRVDRLKALGNGQVPAVAARVFGEGTPVV